MEGSQPEKNCLVSDVQPAATNQGCLRQVFYCVVVASTALHLGMVVGWSGILMKQKNDPDAGVVVSEMDVVWLVSLLGLVWTFSSFVSGPLMEQLGLRRLLLLSLLPSSLCWLLLAFPLATWVMYVGRVGTCVTAGIINTILQPLLAELCQPRYRGFVLTLPEIMVSVGLLFSYALPRFLSWQVSAALLAAPFLPMFLLMLLVPESPYWLLKRDRKDEAKKVLLRLDPSCDVAEEISVIKSSCTDDPTFLEQVQQLKKGRNARPVLLVLSHFLLRELGGPSVIFMYSAYMFALAGVQLDAFTCSILVGAMRLLATMASALVSDRVGRRAMLLCTAVVCAAAQAVAGGALLLGKDTTLGGGTLSLIPLVAVLLYVAFYGVGLAPIPWVLVGELLPTAVRSLGAAIVSSVFALSVFVINFIFPSLIALLSLGGTFLLFAVVNASLALVVLFFLPETSGLTLKEVELVFASKHRLACDETEEICRKEEKADV